MSGIEDTGSHRNALIAAWVFVGIPFAWGVIVTIGNAAALVR